MSVLSDIAAAISECHAAFPRAVVLAAVTGGAMNTSTGVEGTTTVNISCTAILDEEGVDTGVARSGVVTERTYRLMDSDLSGHEPSERDSITDGTDGGVWKVATVRRLAAGKAWAVVCRKVK